MSHPSPQKNGGNNIPPPRQIRFVSTDGQPQTKRRRVNAACRTCRKRKIRCSGEQPVCRTCSDYNHVCLGYSEPPHVRPAADVASRSSVVRPAPGLGEVGASRAAVKRESRSPDSPPRATVPGDGPDRAADAQKTSERKDAPAARDTLRTIKESDQATAGESPESSRTSLSSSARTHVPYFRYFGPTAIVPGFKQMVVQVRGSRKSNPSLSSAESMSSPLRSPNFDTGAGQINAIADNRDTRDANTIPFYDRDDSLPVSNLVKHLCDLFFVHLGCNFPFLQRERFLRDLKEKKIDTMLVDAVCALSARFSLHPLLSPPQAPPIDGSEPPPDGRKSTRGQPFAHRAMNALVECLSCPTLSVVQACLLLAYEEFGSNHDSGLWMYLGISIRMAQDLGMQKLQGLEYSYGQSGVTPNAVMTGQAAKLREEQYDEPRVPQSPATKPQETNVQQRAWERERVDTFWSIFFLDRVISSGTGRPVTLRDEDIELCFPLQSESLLPNGWPAPFPPLIRIIHLYGRVTDLINGIQDVKHVTSDTLKRLAGMESDLTGIYQRLSPRLHFNAANFQAYVKAKEGTNFILLHFWFHTLIVLLHQPTLLNSFGGTIQHLYPNSRELSMSSAKTIADILSFSELVDGKSFIGNPFTSQPMYIAACAFLMESAYYSFPSTGSGSPPTQPLLANQSSGFVMPNIDAASSSERKPTAKHILLASAAKENYQRCYKALKALDTYWEGTRYILTVLDQKAKGIVDPLLYTMEEMESAAETPSAQALSTPDWQRTKTSLGPSSNQDASGKATDGQSDGRRSPRIDPGQAIGWALTGATNSSQPNLSLLYQMPAGQTESAPDKHPAFSSQYSPNYPHIPLQSGTGHNSVPYSQPLEPSRTTAATPGSSAATGSDKYSPMNAGRVTTSDANLLLGLNTSFSSPGARRQAQATYNPGMPSSSRMQNQGAAYNYSLPSGPADQQASGSHIGPRPSEYHPSVGANAGDIFIESQDIDMTTLQQQDHLPFNFNGEILPWLEYLPQDVLSYFGDNQNYSLMSPGDGSSRHPQ